MPGPDAKLNLFLPTTAPFSNLDNPGRRKAQQHPSGARAGGADRGIPAPSSPGPTNRIRRRDAGETDRTGLTIFFASRCRKPWRGTRPGHRTKQSREVQLQRSEDDSGDSGASVKRRFLPERSARFSSTAMSDPTSRLARECLGVWKERTRQGASGGLPRLQPTAKLRCAKRARKGQGGFSRLAAPKTTLSSD